MTERSGSKSETVNQGGANSNGPKERPEEFDIAGNAREKGEKPSPADRDRGEGASNEPAPAIDRR